MDNHNHEHPIIGVGLTILGIASNWMPQVLNLDKEILTPIAHLISIGSGTCAIILFTLTIKQRIKG